MIKEILVICRNPEVVELIQGAIGKKSNASNAKELSGTLASMKKQFDLIFIDLAQLGDDIAATLEMTIRHFRKNHQQAGFGVLAPKERVRQAVEAVNLGANDYLIYPMESDEIRLVLDSATTAIAKNLELAYLRDKFWKSDWLEIIQTHNPVMQVVFEPEDLPHLVDLFLKNLNAKYGKSIQRVHPAVKNNLQTYQWPGNLRELENVLERAYILETGDVLMPERFPQALTTASKIEPPIDDRKELPLAKARQKAIDVFERRYLDQLLKKHRGKINSSAAEAGITTRQLSRLVSRHGLDKKKFR